MKLALISGQSSVRSLQWVVASQVSRENLKHSSHPHPLLLSYSLTLSHLSLSHSLTLLHWWNRIRALFTLNSPDTSFYLVISIESLFLPPSKVIPPISLANTYPLHPKGGIVILTEEEHDEIFSFTEPVLHAGLRNCAEAGARQGYVPF
jgi:hypothetical protein